MTFRKTFPAAAVALAAGAALFTFAATADEQALPVELTDAHAQAEEFIGYYESIELTDEQEAVKREALSAIPAPCCSDNSAYTCCCPCNMAKSNWGLAAWLITEHGYDATQVRESVQEWIGFINPDGFSGDVCYSPGGCARGFAENGCGGMRSSQLDVGR